MRTQEFNKILDERLEKIKNTLAKKAEEYSTEDRLHNFKVAARVNNETPEKALWGMATKHLVSIIDLIEGNHKTTKYMIEEKCGDLINYIILLEALLTEKLDQEDIENKKNEFKNDVDNYAKELKNKKKCKK